MTKILIVVAIASFAVSLAQSMLVTTSAIGPDIGPAVGQHVIDNFNAAAGLSGSYSLVSGSILGIYAAPYLDSSQYLSVGADEAASLAISPTVMLLRFYWGSIDTYESVSFFAGPIILASFTSTQMPAAPADGSQSNPLNNRRVTFGFDGQAITRMRFASSRTAFEIDTVAAGIPEPAKWAIMLVGFGLVGVSARRRGHLLSAAS